MTGSFVTDTSFLPCNSKKTEHLSVIFCPFNSKISPELLELTRQFHISAGICTDVRPRRDPGDPLPRTHDVMLLLQTINPGSSSW